MPVNTTVSAKAQCTRFLSSTAANAPATVNTVIAQNEKLIEPRAFLDAKAVELRHGNMTTVSIRHLPN